MQSTAIATSNNKVSSGVCEMRKVITFCASAQSHLEICSGRHLTVTGDSVSGQGRLRSDGAYAQSALSLHCPHIPEFHLRLSHFIRTDSNSTSMLCYLKAILYVLISIRGTSMESSGFRDRMAVTPVILVSITDTILINGSKDDIFTVF